MADTKISAFTAATDLASADIPIVQAGANKKAAATFVWQTKTGGTLTGNNVLNLGGFSLTFQGTTEDIILGTTSTASSTGTQANSLPVHFKSSLWTGSAETKGWFSWRADASTAVNRSQTLTLYQSTGSSPSFSTPLFNIDSTGNAGIGTVTNSGYRFGVNGNLWLGGSTIKLEWGATIGSTIFGGFNHNTASGEFRMFGSGGGHYLTFYANGAEALRIDTNRNMVPFDGLNFIFGTTTGTKFGTATSQLIGFWNKTPIVQPTTGVGTATRVGGGGTTVTDTDTFGGYKIGQIVQALQNIGLLA